MKLILPIVLFSIIATPALAQEKKPGLQAVQPWEADVDTSEADDTDEHFEDEKLMTVEKSTKEAEEVYPIEEKAPVKSKDAKNETLCSKQPEKFGKSKWQQSKENFSNYNILQGTADFFNSGACFVMDYGSDPKKAANDAMELGGKVITTTGTYAKKVGAATAEALEKNPKKHANHEEEFSLTPKYGK